MRAVQAEKSDKMLLRVKSALDALADDRDLPWLAKKAGIPSSTFYDNLNKGVISKTEVAVKVAEALGVSVDWLLTGRDPGELPRNVATLDQGDDPADAAQRLGLILIPEVDISYSMGGGAFADEYTESRLVPFRRDWLERIGRGQPFDPFLAGGVGDSMTPTIFDGDDVLVNRAEKAIRHQDRIWAVGYGELGMIKRVRRLPNGIFQLNSDNPAVTPIEATEDEIFIVGRVAWIGRRV